MSLKIKEYLFSQGSINNFTNIQIKKIKKSMTFVKSFSKFHKHSFQIPSNLTIYQLIQTTLSSTHNTLSSTYNPLKFL